MKNQNQVAHEGQPMSREQKIEQLETERDRLQTELEWLNKNLSHMKERAK